MTVAFLLTELRSRGIELLVDRGTLRYRCPEGALTHELRQAVATNRAELLRTLTPPPPTSPIECRERHHRRSAAAGYDDRRPLARCGP